MGDAEPNANAYEQNGQKEQTIAYKLDRQKLLLWLPLVIDCDSLSFKLND